MRLDLPFERAAGDISTQVSGSYRSSSVYADVSSFNPATHTVYPTSVLPAYTTFDARIDWHKIFGTGLSAAGDVRNFTDKHYAVGRQDVTQLGFSSIILGQPRLFPARRA